jgi:hypothetical protein
MTALSTRCFVLLLVALGIFVPSAPADAQRVPARALREARDKLREYEPGAVLEAIASLTQFLAVGRDGVASHDRDEARFLRATSSADLLLLSGRPGWTRLEVKVAKALGVPAESLAKHLDEELRALQFGRFRFIAEDARAALSYGTHETDEDARGPRLDLLRLSNVAAALTADDPVATLAALARDPCEPGPCEESLFVLSGRSRRALVAFQRGLMAAARLDLAADHGDPFSRAAETEIEQLTSDLVKARLPLRPRPEPGLGALEGEQSADVFITVTDRSFIVQSAVIYGLHEGAVRPLSKDGCGRRVEVAIPAALGGRITGVPALARALPRACGRKVAVAAEDSVEAHLVLRALESVRAAGLVFVGLAGVDATGELAVRAIDLVHVGKNAIISMAAHHLCVGRGAKREQVPLASLAVPEPDDLARLARALTVARVVSSLGVAGDVPFLALRVILRALEDAPVLRAP